MLNKSTDIVVKNLMRYKGKLINIPKIENLLKNVIDDKFTNQKMYKLIYYLKNRGYIYNIKKNIFLVKNPENEINQSKVLNDFYRQILKKHCNEFLKSDRYIGGLKALELNIDSYSAPEEILVVNNYKQSNEILCFDKQISFKTYLSGKEKLFSFFYKFTKKINIKKNVFWIARLELAILESLYNPGLVNMGYVNELIKRILREQKSNIDIGIWEKILKKNKHHTSINRLYKLVLTIDPDFAEKIKNLIKKYSYFIT